MSWLKTTFGTEPERYVEPEDTPKVADPAIPNRMVSTKAANQPFLAHKEYRDKQEGLHKAYLERKKIRDEKIARGEDPGPEERDPTEVTELGLLSILKFLVYLLLALALAGKFFTGSFTWEYESQWLRLKTYLPSGQRLFSEKLLAEFNGRVPERPIYLAIDGDVYDVTGGKAYAPGGSYAILTGVDAARAFGTGCFQTHLTHDLRGLSEQELQGVQHWKKFYSEHKDYKKIGRVSHPTIDPASPIPPPCTPGQGKAAEQQKPASKPENKPKKAAHGAGRSEL